MRNTILIIISVLLTGFITPAQAQHEECPIDEFMVARVTISYGDAYIKAEPAFVQVCPGGRIIVTLDPVEPYEIMDVELKGRMKDQEWLRKAYRAMDLKEKDFQFVIEVPEDQPAKIYKYYVKVPGVGYLDPRVEVLP